jgi:hypothetical protein
VAAMRVGEEGQAAYQSLRLGLIDHSQYLGR